MYRYAGWIVGIVRQQPQSSLALTIICSRNGFDGHLLRWQRPESRGRRILSYPSCFMKLPRSARLLPRYKPARIEMWRSKRRVISAYTSTHWCLRAGSRQLKAIEAAVIPKRKALVIPPAPAVLAGYYAIPWRKGQHPLYGLHRFTKSLSTIMLVVWAFYSYFSREKYK